MSIGAHILTRVLPHLRMLPRRANKLQTSSNLALGSELATIGLTIPAAAVVSIMLRQPLELAPGEKDQILLALTLLVGVVTLGTGRTTVLQGMALGRGVFVLRRGAISLVRRVGRSVEPQQSASKG
jgi:hypothetical protein